MEFEDNIIDAASIMGSDDDKIQDEDKDNNIGGENEDDNIKGEK